MRRGACPARARGAGPDGQPAVATEGADPREIPGLAVLLKAAVVIQLIPFIYLFLALTKTSGVRAGARAAGVIGLLTTVVGLAAAFLPTSDVTSVTVFEAKTVIGVAGPIGIGWILFARSRAASAV